MKNVHKRSKRNLMIGFGFSLIVLILSSGLSYFSIVQLLESQKMVDHSTQVEASLESMISRMKDAETGQRGFLLTGEEEFLEPYKGTKAEVMAFLSAAETLTRDNDVQQKEFPLLEEVINNKFNLIDLSIQQKRRGIPPTATALLKGKFVMDSVRAIVSTMIKHERQLMASRNVQMDKFATYTPIFIGIAALLAMIITVLFYLRVQKDANLAVILQKELVIKEEHKQRQISTIGGIAEQIAKGNYSVRIDENDLK